MFPNRLLLLVLVFIGAKALAEMATSSKEVQQGQGTDSPRRVEVAILHFTDTHAQVKEHPELFWSDDHSREELTQAGGFARLYTVVEHMRQQYAGRVLLLDGGDTIQGSALGVFSKGKGLVPILNFLGIDGAVPGNWEVVYGVDSLKQVTAMLNYPMIAANIVDQATKQLAFAPYKIYERGGIKIAVIGYTDPEVPERQPPSYSKGFSYLRDDVIQPIVDDIRNNKKADVIILLSHIGLPKAVELSSRIKGIDLHLSGDTHERTYTPILKNHWVVESGAFTSFLGKAILVVEEGKVVDKKWELLELRAERYPEHTELKRIIDKAVAPIFKKLSRKIGETKDPLFRYGVNQTSLDMILSDAIREATGADIGFSNGFRFAPPLVPGPILEWDLFTIYPVNMPLRVGEVTGKQLWDWWEKEIEHVYSQDPKKLFGGWLPRPSGLTIRFLANAPRGQRVKEILIHGKPIDLQKTYSVGACIREGDPENRVCRIPDIKNPRDFTIDAHTAVKNYLKKFGPLREPAQLRVIAEDLPTIVRSQYYRR
ncbi:MAG: bifunctional metallophosphatase/5'-nucleotidase [Bdellovibrionaceae bacterium]|nr:bifunctional metallophosphatase/5'-nucleotidase [Pseudobdellovibrionaceae bacterium]MDW8190688.1 bifunctional metallophosphatase/5'-nucleotidase [Pseudobdellovibrionaceae bacterium]